MVLRGIARLLAPGGPRGRLSILIFHRVLPQADPLFPDEPDGRRFDDILTWIADWFQVIALDDAVARLGAGTLPPRSLAITFDDGYADNAAIALPILQRHGMTATFFIATSFLNGGRMWNDTVVESVRNFSGNVLDLNAEGFGTYPVETVAQRRAAIDALLPKIKYLAPANRVKAVDSVARRAGALLPNDLMMNSDQVRQLHMAGMQVGAHTCNHPILANLPDDEAMREITASKAILEVLLDQPVALFAYPNGKPGQDYLGKHAAMVKQAGYAAAVSTAAGVSNAATDVFQFPRFTPWDRTRLRFGVRLMENLRSKASLVA